jgi:1,4-dihydroxy-2-naphthoate octaprenyltransferase
MTIILVNTLLVFCTLFLIAALVSAGAGVLALLSIFASLGLLIFVSLPPRTPALLAITRKQRRISSRAPPRF